MSLINVLIVDDDSTRASTLAYAIGQQNDIKLLASVAKIDMAVKHLASSPSTLLLNPSVLKQRKISRFLRSVSSKSPATRVLLLHREHPGDDMLIDEIRMGARGYLHADAPPALVIKAIRAVMNGEIWAERRVLEKTISRHMLLPETLRSHVPDLQPLTGREMDMLNMVLKGASNREIAEMSNISERTVKTHLYRVYRKLKVKSRAKAIALLANS